MSVSGKLDVRGVALDETPVTEVHVELYKHMSERWVVGRQESHSLLSSEKFSMMRPLPETVGGGTLVTTRIAWLTQDCSALNSGFTFAVFLSQSSQPCDAGRGVSRDVFSRYSVTHCRYLALRRSTSVVTRIPGW